MQSAVKLFLGKHDFSSFRAQGCQANKPIRTIDDASIEVKGKKYPGLVPMTPFSGMLNDKEMAAVLTYSRNAFGNTASAITPEEVKAVRDATKDFKGFYSPDALLKEHPMEK